MATRKDQGKSAEGSTPPASTPGESTPSFGTDHSFTLQAIMEMQKALGALTKQIEGLDTRVGKLSEDVGKHGKWIFAANVVLLIGLGVLGFLAKILWDIAKAKLGLP